MSFRLVSITLVMVVMFVLSLLISYYGFQVSPNFVAQMFSESEGICEKSDLILEFHDISYPHIIRTISDETGLDNLGLNSEEIKTIEQCLQSNLPRLDSTLITEKIGFFESVGGHFVKGKSIVVPIEQDNYLRLENFEIGIEHKKGTEFQIPELHVYLSKNNIPSPEIYLDKLKVKLGNKNYKLPDVDLNTYNTVVIYDEIHKEPHAKNKIRRPFLY